VFSRESNGILCLGRFISVSKPEQALFSNPNYVKIEICLVVQVLFHCAVSDKLVKSKALQVVLIIRSKTEHRNK